MKVPARAIGLMLVLAAFTVPLMSQSIPKQVPLMSPGVHDTMLALAGGKTLRYAISIPRDYSPAATVPLVLALHFGGDSNGAALGVMRILIVPALADLGAVIVAPETLGGAWDTTENERAVNTLLEAVQATYRIDSKKIAVTGFSMGGAGTWHFAGKYPERFSAAVPVAGRPPATAEGWKTPVFAVHSRNDEVVPLRPTETRMKELKQAGVRSEFVVLTGISHYETGRFVEGLRRAVPWLRELWK